MSTTHTFIDSELSIISEGSSVGASATRTFQVTKLSHGTSSFEFKTIDSDGLFSLCSFLIDTVDAIAPAVQCPAFRSSPTMPDTSFRNIAAIIYNELIPAPTDNAFKESLDPSLSTVGCTYLGVGCMSFTATLPGSPPGQLNADISGERKNYTVDVTVTDTSGNTGVCSFQHEVYDDEPPTFTSKFLY